MSIERPSVTVDFFADLSCPWCYVGWGALKQAAAQTRARAALTLIWRTFLLAPNAPMEGVDRAEALARIFAGDSARLARTQDVLAQAAREIGLPLNLDAAERIPNTLKAHRLVHLASTYGLGEPVIDALFSAYFVEGLDIGDATQLIAIAESLGLDPQETALALAIEDFSDLSAMHEAAIKIGVSGVPVAIFNRKTPVMGAESVAAYARAIEAAI